MLPIRVRVEHHREPGSRARLTTGHPADPASVHTGCNPEQVVETVGSRSVDHLGRSL